MADLIWAIKKKEPWGAAEAGHHVIGWGKGAPTGVGLDNVVTDDMQMRRK